MTTEPDPKRQRQQPLSLPASPLLLSQLVAAGLIHAAELDQGVLEALSTGSHQLERLYCTSTQLHQSAVAQVREAADAARESTFPFLETGSEPRYCAAYAAASLWFAEASVHEAAAASAAGNSVAAGDAAAAALRACDLAILRGGVDEWSALAAPIVNAASVLAEATQCDGTSSGDVKGGGALAHRELEALKASCTLYEECGRARAVPRVDARLLDSRTFRERYMQVRRGLLFLVTLPRHAVAVTLSPRARTPPSRRSECLPSAMRLRVAGVASCPSHPDPCSRGVASDGLPPLEQRVLAPEGGHAARASGDVR